MLPKNKRVNKELFRLIIKQGKTISSSIFLFRYIPQNKPQYAFVAPKSIAKKAVDRNYLRRQGYNALYLYPLKLYAGIFFYKKKVKEASFKEIKNEIKSILEKLR